MGGRELKIGRRFLGQFLDGQAPSFERRPFSPIFGPLFRGHLNHHLAITFGRNAGKLEGQTSTDSQADRARQGEGRAHGQDIVADLEHGGISKLCRLRLVRT